MGKLIAVIFASAYLLTLLVTAPASLLGELVQIASQDRLLLANASGTVWNGRATPALRTRDDHLLALQSLHWKIAVSSLLAGKVQVLLQSDEPLSSLPMQVIITFKQIELNHAQFNLPAQVLSELTPMLQPAQLRGQLQIHGEKLAFSRQGMQGNAVIDWHDASSGVSSLAPLGNYHLILTGTGELIQIGLSTASGMLQLNGSGNWKAGTGLEFHGKAQASAGNEDKLTELLHHLGPQVSPGVHGFNLIPH